MKIKPEVKKVVATKIKGMVVAKEKIMKGDIVKIIKEKKPKIELVTYTIRATIPTGAYSNICPEVIVKAESLEIAERAVMPHIERLFAKYRDTNGQSREIVEVAPQTLPVASVVIPTAPVVQPVAVANAPVAPIVTPAPVTVLNNVPMQRAAQAINSCTSIEALNLITAQVKKSEKLTEAEKSNAYSLINVKEFALISGDSMKNKE
jgi:hypothetical protein